jgi:predicted alpha/beta-hydrolase family hydrolase
MIAKPTTIDIPGKGPVSAVLAVPDYSNETVHPGVIIAHGAANDMNNPLIVAAAEGLADAGHVTLRFNFLYKENKKKSPDGQKTLVRTWQSAHAYLMNNPHAAVSRIIAAGKSMGGRIAAQMAAAGELDAAALIFLGYPLHAPGRTDKLRDSHLYDIKAPMLFFAGTRDPLCNLEKLRKVLGRLKGPVDLETVDGGDHSFRLPKSSHRPPSAVHDQIVNKCIQWIESL